MYIATIVNKRWEVIGIYCFLLLTPNLKYKKFLKMYYLKVEFIPERYIL